MKIAAFYRGEETEHLDGKLCIDKYDDGSIRLRERSFWPGNRKHYFADLDPHELLELRNVIDVQLGKLTDQSIVSVSRKYLENLIEHQR